MVNRIAIFNKKPLFIFDTIGKIIQSNIRIAFILFNENVMT